MILFLLQKFLNLKTEPQTSVSSSSFSRVFFTSVFGFCFASSLSVTLTFVFTLAFGLSLTSCSSLSEKWQSFSLSTRSAEKEFKVQGVWVRSTLDQVNERYRKINRATPILADEKIIQLNALDGVAAYTPDQGRLLWKKNIPEGVESSGVFFKGKVFLAAQNGTVQAIELAEGRTLWSYSTKSENVGQPFLDSQQGVLYLLAGNNIVHALDAESGKVNWIYSRQDTSAFSIRGGSQPVLKNDLLYVGFSEGSFVALNAKSGTVAWEIQLNKNKKFRDIDAGAVIDQDRIYVSGFDDKLYCLSLKGEILWKLDHGGYSAVKIQDQMLFYPTTTGQVLAIDKNNGQILWKYKLAEGLATEVQIYKGLVVFGESQGKLIFLNKNDGQFVGSFEPGRGIMSKPLIDEAHSMVYFISGEANLYALKASWEQKPDFSFLK